MIKSENWKRLSMRKRPELSAKLVFKDLHGEIRNSHDVRRVCDITMPSIFTAGFGIYRFDYKTTRQKMVNWIYETRTDFYRQQIDSMSVKVQTRIHKLKFHVPQLFVVESTS